MLAWLADKGAPFSPSKDSIGSNLAPAPFTHLPSKPLHSLTWYLDEWVSS